MERITKKNTNGNIDESTLLFLFEAFGRLPKIIKL